MIRILFFLIVVFGMGLGFAWLADRPGDIELTFNGYRYEVTLMVAAVAITALIAGVMITWWLVKAIWTSPHTVARYFRVRRRDRGYQALSSGMIAAGAGDAAKARVLKKQAAKLIRSDQEPLIHLLDAQASLLEGDHEAARQKFEAMLDDPEMRMLGLRGLYLEAERLGDRAAARHYAGRAAEVAPQLIWASTATLEEKTEREDWDGALKLLDAQKSSRQIERDVANRRRAVLLTAKAMSLLDTDPTAAKSAALEANRLQPELVPAAVTAAQVLFRQNDIRKGAKILEASWKIEPHPEVGELYIHARPGDATHDRLTRAKKLQALKQNNAESFVIVARAALEAGEYGFAREAAEAAVRMQPREGAYLLLADIEEAETGDQGRVRQFLSKAVRAPRDPAWVADGFVSERWAPTSPVTGKLDAYEWRAPMERLATMIDLDDEVVDGANRVMIAASQPMAEADDIDDAEVVSVVDDAPSVPPIVADTPTPEPASPEAAPPALRRARPTRESGAEAVAFMPTSPPDDPGVPPDDETEEKPARFRLF
ncbi:heme biosynthesis protein HemY [Mesorhizobium sp. NBSH29]|uniref:heme biosynthesis protein HemY n=1 Tax=Mesorhizobium sp. NBSH29 TaxID=2654249 RepID=UPI0018967876|nr:heme biosynthesis protein HemY [Mesorhizobium sp. NBSH29]QPC85969.1 heme biosynthesis protein HemY [Mesorhizobium sp. NBSH29]